MVYLIITFCCLALVIIYRRKKFLSINTVSSSLSDISMEANAVLLDIQYTKLALGNSQHVTLQVQVQPDEGRNFVSEVKEFFSESEIINFHVGSLVKVKYNPSNRKQIVMIK